MEVRLTSQLTSIIDLRLQKLDVVSERCDIMEDSIDKNSENIAELFNEQVTLCVPPRVMHRQNVEAHGCKMSRR